MVLAHTKKSRQAKKPIRVDLIHCARRFSRNRFKAATPFHFVLCHCTRKREEAQKQGVNQPSFGGGKRVSISEK
jgi:hypothetical protein